MGKDINNAIIGAARSGKAAALRRLRGLQVEVQKTWSLHRHTFVCVCMGFLLLNTNVFSCIRLYTFVCV